MIVGYIQKSNYLALEKQKDLIGECDKLIGEPKKKDSSLLEEPAVIYQTKKQALTLQNIVQNLKEGDTLKVAALEVLDLSALQLIEFVDFLNERKVTLISVLDQIQDQMIFTKLHHIQRIHRRKATLPALNAARARGRNGGRKKGLSPEAERKASAAVDLYQAGKMSIGEICETLGIVKSTLYRYLRHKGIEINQ